MRIRAVVTLALLAAPLAAQAPAPWYGKGVHSSQAATVDRSRPIGVDGVAGVGLTVSDVDRSVRFYTGLLGFTTVSDTTIDAPALGRLVGVPGARTRVVRLQLGSELLELTQYAGRASRPPPTDSRSNDAWFQHVAIIVSDMNRAYAQLAAAGVTAASAGGPQELPAWNPNAGGIRAFYFRDPDGHFLEILQFPEGKGLAKWHDSTGRLFLGIDHTAIVVRNTERSLAFYRDALGLSVAGRSDNYGPEQERLNNVPDAHLRITSLRGAAGPGIEFLEYLTPRTGRPYPRDERASDLVHWQTRLLVPDADAAAARLRAESTPFVSPGAVALAPGIVAGAARGLQVRDPDGHVLQLIEP
jgi:catechol 2,3-dioxygenase-like lactoylglutathione lyase family enzyme